MLPDRVKTCSPCVRFHVCAFVEHASYCVSILAALPVRGDVEPTLQMPFSSGKYIARPMWLQLRRD